MMRLSNAGLMAAGLLASLMAAAQAPGLPPERIPAMGQMPSNVPMLGHNPMPTPGMTAVQPGQPGQPPLQSPFPPDQMAPVPVAQPGAMPGTMPGAMPGSMPGAAPGGMSGQDSRAMAQRASAQAEPVLELRATLPSVPLGRLFATPAQREQMNRQRGAVAQTTLAAPAAQPASPQQSQQSQQQAPAEPVRLDGVVKSSSGRAIIWLNGQQQPDGGARVRADHAVTLQLSSGRKVLLKPGQSYDADDRRVKEYNSEP